MLRGDDAGIMCDRYTTCCSGDDEKRQAPSMIKPSEERWSCEMELVRYWSICARNTVNFDFSKGCSPQTVHLMVGLRLSGTVEPKAQTSRKC